MVKKPASPGTARQMDSTADARYSRTSGTLAPPNKFKFGYLSRYAKLVSSASTGAVLK